MLNDRWKARPDVLIVILLTVATLGIYWNVLTFSFITLDDPDYVSHNIHVQDGLSLPNVIWAFTDITPGYGHPLTWITLMADYELYGMNAGGYHWTNVLFHIMNTLLLFMVMYRMTGAVWRSGFVAALFALHPLHVESVAWVAERKDVLSGFFWMLVMLGYVYYVERPGFRRYLLVLVLFVMGLMSKPMLVTLPFALLLMDYWPLGRYRFGVAAGRSDVDDGRVSLSRLIWEKVPLLVVAVGVSIGTYWSAKHAGMITSSEALSLEIRIANAVSSYVLYIGKMFWPVDLAVFYPHPGTWSLGALTGYGAILIILSFFMVWFGRQYAYLIVGWLWYLGTLVPVIGIVQPGMQAMADRFTYIPLIGLFIILTWGSIDFLKRQSYSIQRVMPLYAIILFVFMLVACIQVQYWKDSERLFTHALEVTHDNYVANGGLGLAYLDAGDLTRADYYLREAIRIDSRYAVAYQNLGHIDYRLKKWDAAAEHFRESLKWENHFINKAKGHNNLGVSLLMKGNIDEAMDEFKNAIEINPDLARAKINLKNAYMLKERRMKGD
jgi:predicted negative regulator of RcsB-dependent stress response